jgi:hypothetical protein
MLADQSAIVSVVTSQSESTVFADLANRGSATCRHEFDIALCERDAVN